MDACLYYLDQIDVVMEGYKEKSLAEFIFETEDENASESIVVNAQAEVKSENLLKKAANAIRKIFNKIKEILHTMVEWFTVSSKERKGYKDFVKACKSDPELAKKTITLHDYRKVVAGYEAALSNAEKSYRDFKDTEAEDRPSILKDVQADVAKLKDQTKTLLARTGSKFTVAAALKYAQANRENAARVQMMIDYDLRLLNDIEQQIGKKQAKKFKRKIKHLQSRFKIIRYIAGGRQEQALTLKEACTECVKELGTVEGMSKAIAYYGGKEATGPLATMGKTVAKGVAAAPRVDEGYVRRNLEYQQKQIHAAAEHKKKKNGKS